MPPSNPPILCWISSSTRLLASFIAASTISCSISTSPATSGSILTAETFFLPSIFTETIPPPADASTRISAISSCILFCICCACFIICCMFPGSFMVSIRLFLQVSHGPYLRVREEFLKPLHFRVGERALGDIVAGARHRLRRSGRAESDLRLHSPAGDGLNRLVQVLVV